jgi:hypothetical protein
MSGEDGPMTGWRKTLVAAFVVTACAGACGSPAVDAPEFNGERLFADVQHYAELGPHVSGGAGDEATRDWIASELAAAGYDVEINDVPHRIWRPGPTTITAGEGTIEAMVLGWPPETPSARVVEGPLRAAADAGEGDIALIRLVRPITGPLPAGAQTQLEDALARGAAGAVVLTETISGAPYAFNLRRDEEPRSAPVVVAGSLPGASLDGALAEGRVAQISIDGVYTPGGSWNVVGRLDRAGTRTVTVSTPRTGWGTSGAERGPGVAIFLALAHWAARTGDADLVFVATGAHEIGHSGMDQFLVEGAPPTARTALWLHLGSSIAAWSWADEASKSAAEPSGENTGTRWLVYSADLTFAVSRLFTGLDHQHSPAWISAFGEAADIRSAGYRTFFAFAGAHDYFHLPDDDAANTAPELLEPRARAAAALMSRSL